MAGQPPLFRGVSTSRRERPARGCCSNCHRWQSCPNSLQDLSPKRMRVRGLLRSASRRPLPFVRPAWRSNCDALSCSLGSLGRLRSARQSLEIDRDKFSTPPQTPAALPAAGPVPGADRPVVRAPGRARPGETGCLPSMSSASAARRKRSTASSFLPSP